MVMLLKVIPFNNVNHIWFIFYIKGENKEKENKSFLVNESQSPPLSVKLKEMSDYLKSLNSSTPVPLHDSTNTQVCISKPPKSHKNWIFQILIVNLDHSVNVPQAWRLVISYNLLLYYI